MRFGEYIRTRRKDLKLRQNEVTGFAQAYISDIENGKKIPTRRETIEALAEGLKIPHDQVVWLWVYSLLDYDPREYFGASPPAFRNHVNESGIPYGAATAELETGMSPAAVSSLLGVPTRIARFEALMWWVYQDLGLRIRFVDDAVVAVESL